MPAKLRRSKTRIHITDEITELFRRGCEIVEAGDQEIWEKDAGRRREYLDLTRKLNWGLLKIPPSDAGPLDIVELGDDDEEGGSPTKRASLPRARELYEILQREISRCP
jgi:hypothetical protein